MEKYVNKANKQINEYKWLKLPKHKKKKTNWCIIYPGSLMNSIQDQPKESHLVTEKKK